MHVLALDTSTPKIVLALRTDSGDFHMSYMGTEKHAVRLAPLLQNLTKTADIEFEDIDMIGLGVGPGNLTGLRIGISTILGISSTFEIPVVQLNSLELISKNVSTNLPKVVVRKARKGFVYAQIFDGNHPKPRVYSIEEFSDILSKIEEYVLLGDGSVLFDGEKAPEWSWYPLAETLLHETISRVKEAVRFTEIKPLYVQKSIAELNLGGRKRNGV